MFNNKLIRYSILSTCGLASSLVVQTALGQAVCLDQIYGDDRKDTVCYGLNDSTDSSLADQLRSRSRVNPEFKFVQGANGRNGAPQPHRQFGGSCHLFAHQAALEHLGFARKETDSHLSVPVNDFAESPNHGAALSKDVGYLNSPEHLIISELNSPESPVGTRTSHDSDWDNYWNSSIDKNSTWACTEGTWWPTNDVPEYGECNLVPANRIWTGFRWANNGYGQHWIDFINKSLRAGCNDAVYVPGVNHFLPSSTNLVYFRAMLKAFVDNNIPMPIYVGETHWVTVMGYADIEADGYPSTVFASDPAQYFGNQQGYREYRNLHFLGAGSSWGGAASNGDVNLITKIAPWNQHLNGGCKTGGWAKEFDDQWASSKPAFTLCSGFGSVDCSEGTVDGAHPRFYGANIECWNNGQLVEELYATSENPFVSLKRNIFCDEVKARYSDGRSNRQVSSATITRYGYTQATQAWTKVSAYSAKPSTGTLSVVTEAGRGDSILNLMDFSTWQQDYYLVGTGFTGQYSKIRSSIVMSFDDGSKQTIEISPPGVYGVDITCTNDGSPTHYFLEADNSVNWLWDETTGIKDEVQHISVPKNTDCDDVSLKLALGNNGERQDPVATVARYGYHVASAQWKALNGAAWTPDTATSSTSSGLSGKVHTINWTDKWPSNYRFVSDDLSGDYSQRMTEFVLQFASSNNGPGGDTQVVRRTIQVVPY